MAKHLSKQERAEIPNSYRRYRQQLWTHSEAMELLINNTGKTPARIRQILQDAGISPREEQQKEKLDTMQKAPDALPTILERAQNNCSKPLDAVSNNQGKHDFQAFADNQKAHIWIDRNGFHLEPVTETLSNDIDGDDFLELKPLPKRVDFTPDVSADYERKPLEKKNLPKEHRVKLTGSKTELFATDVHFPYHDIAGWELFVQVAIETQPDILWLNGDILDLYPTSQWDKTPQVAHENHIQNEFDYTRNKLEELRAVLPNAQFYYKEGNHETRLQRFLNKNAPALRYLKSLTVPFNLGLKDLDIEWIDNNDKYRIGDLWHFHGNEIGGGGVNAALAKLRKMMTNIIFGHLHIEQSAIMRKYDGTPIGAWAIPALCDLSQEYAHHAENWSNGFARVEYLPSGLFHVQPTQILTDGDRKICRVDGQWFEQELCSNT